METPEFVFVSATIFNICRVILRLLVSKRLFLYQKINQDTSILNQIFQQFVSDRQKETIII
jgi:hypothetical protein